MPSFEFETLGRDWSSVVHEPASLAALDDSPDPLKSATACAIGEAFRTLRVGEGDRPDRTFVVSGETDGRSFSLSVMEKGETAKAKAAVRRKAKTAEDRRAAKAAAKK